ncbi:MAG TPA: hypothetical protein PK595_06365 [Bacteroidota bacterium]|nr:hypothetical protein [Bacteroidota bacterium]
MAGGKTAVALFADGLELKYVRLSAKGKQVTVEDFKTVALTRKIEEKAAITEEAIIGELSTTEYGSIDTIGVTGGEETSNSSALLNLLNEAGSPRKYTLSYAITEPAITYHEFESNFGLKGDKLKKRIIEELTASRGVTPSIDAIDVIPTATGGILAVIREDGIQMYEALNELKPFLGGKVPTIRLVKSADFALMEFVRSEYSPQEEEITVIVYVGHDFSRLIFMEGENYLHFAPIISEGFGSPNIENTIYSRILLEQDNIALTRIDRILLAGEAHKVNLYEAIAPQFSSALVEYMKSSSLDFGAFEGSIGNAISEYVIPIVTAWHTLEPKHPAFYPVNIIPQRIIEGQRVLALAWHGVLVAIGIIFTIVFFYTSIMHRQTEIRRMKDEVQRNEERLVELETLEARKTTLQNDINRYKDATTVYSEVAPGSDRWSRVLHYLANSVEDLNSLWLMQVQPDPRVKNAILIKGRALYRSRIPRIASAFEKATLREVRTITIRDKVLYEFEIVVEKVDKYDIPETEYKGQR